MLASPSDSLTFRLVYDVRQAFPDLWLPGLATLFLLCMGIAFYRNAHRFESLRAGVIGVGFIVLSCFLALFFIGTMVLPYLGLRRHVARGEYRIVQGTVRNFVPGDGHRSESWTVDTGSGALHYSYSPSIVGEGGYDRVAAFGGIVREGARVRVMDVNGRIARLEVMP